MKLRGLPILFLSLILSALAWGEVEWGMMSGTFDPPTVGHLKLIRDAVVNDKVGTIYVLVNITGSKDFKASYAEREAMLKLGLQDIAHRVVIMPVRQEQKNTEAIEALRNKHPGKQYHAYIGEDSYKVLPTDMPHDPLRTWKVMPRAETDPSSTAVRAAFAEGKPVPFLEPKIRDYILRRGLYLAPPSRLLVPQTSLFETARLNLITKLQEKYPGVAWNIEDPMTFEPYQSRLGWGDKFMRYVEKRTKDPEILEFARRQLYTPTGEPKYAYLRELGLPAGRAEGTTVPIPPVLLQTLKATNSPVFIHQGTSLPIFERHQQDGFSQYFHLDGVAGESALIAYHPAAKQFRVILQEPKDGFKAEVLNDLEGLPTYQVEPGSPYGQFICLAEFRGLKTSRR